MTWTIRFFLTFLAKNSDGVTSGTRLVFLTGVTSGTDSSTKGHSNPLNVFHLLYRKRKREKADNKTISTKVNTSFFVSRCDLLLLTLLRRILHLWPNMFLRLWLLLHLWPGITFVPSTSLPSLPPHYSGASMVYLLGNEVDRWYISGNLAACVIVKGVHGYPKPI